MTSLGYGLVTPVRDESANLRRLAASLEEQTHAPICWHIVDTGSADSTRAVARELALRLGWVVFSELPLGGVTMRGGPIVRAFHFGLPAIPEACDVVVKLDADVSMEPDYFHRLLGEFARDPRLGIASGSVYERGGDGAWRQRHGTGAGVWGAARAYRRACLDEILPLEERIGWDTIDAVKAALRGWDARVIDDLPFFHHRPEGARDKTRFGHWVRQGEASRYMGYRLSYLVLRTLYRAVREPQALGILAGYLGAVVRREPVCSDPAVRRHVREQQGARNVPRRVREALRVRRSLDGSSATRSDARDAGQTGGRHL